MKQRYGLYDLPQIAPIFRRYCPRDRILKIIWPGIESRNYPRKLHPADLIPALMKGYLRHASSDQEIVDSDHEQLNTDQDSTFCYALERTSTLELVKAELELFVPSQRTKPMSLAAIDSTPITVHMNQRSNCSKYNDRCKGATAMYCLYLDTNQEECPVEILQVARKHTHDTKLLAQTALIANGPLYLMDRGCYAIYLVQRWITDSVHFIVRARKTNLTYTELYCQGAPRYGPKQIVILQDLVVWLGAPACHKERPLVRLIEARLPDGEDLILVSSELDASAETLIEDYGRRGEIEDFNRFTKEEIGLAHLYSLQDTGIDVQLHVACLLSILLSMADCEQRTKSIERMRQQLREIRKLMHVGKLWKRNTLSHVNKHKKKHKDPANQTLSCTISLGAPP